MQIDLSHLATKSDLEDMKKEFDKKIIDVRINSVKMVIDIYENLREKVTYNKSIMKEIAEIRIASLDSHLPSSDSDRKNKYLSTKYGKNWWDKEHKFDQSEYVNFRDKFLQKLHKLTDSEANMPIYSFYKEWVNLITEYRFLFGESEITEEYIRDNMFIDFFGATSDIM